MLNKSVLYFLGIVLVVFQSACAQKILTEKEAIEAALSRNPQMKIASLKIEKQQSLKSTGVSLPNTEILFQAPTGTEFRPGILQQFDFPTVYGKQVSVYKAGIEVAKADQQITKNSLIYNVRTTYNQVNFLIEKYNTLRRQDSIFDDILKINELRYNVGQISNLEKINGEAYYKQIQFNLLQTYAALQYGKIQLSILIGSPEDNSITAQGKLEKIIDYTVEFSPDTTFASNPLTAYYLQQQKQTQKLLQVEKNKRLPGIVVGYLNQAGTSDPTLYRLQVGVTLPLWYWTYKGKIAAARKDVEILQSQSKLNNYSLKGEYAKELAKFKQYQTAVQYFETVGRAQASEILKSARESFRLGSISYYIYLQNINQAFQIELNSLEALKNYNESLIALQYLLGNTNY